MRTASSAVPLAASQERTSLVSLRNNRFPISSERFAASVRVSGFVLTNPEFPDLRPACVPVPRCTDFPSRTANGTRTVAMRPGSRLATAKDKEFSCRKNWLSTQPPMNAGLRSWKKVS